MHHTCMYQTHGCFNYIHWHQYNPPPHYYVFFDFTHSMFYIITLIELVCTQLMSVFIMFTQMIYLKCFLFTLIAIIWNGLMSILNMFTQLMDLIFFNHINCAMQCELCSDFYHVLQLHVVRITFVFQTSMFKCHYSLK